MLVIFIVLLLMHGEHCPINNFYDVASTREIQALTSTQATSHTEEIQKYFKKYQ